MTTPSTATTTAFPTSVTFARLIPRMTRTATAAATATTSAPAVTTPSSDGDGVPDFCDLTRTVADLQALRDLEDPGPETAEILAHSDLGDGGGGFFTWIADSTADDNDGTVITPTGWSGAGR